jgi:hypothetical protein
MEFPRNIQPISIYLSLLLSFIFTAPFSFRKDPSDEQHEADRVRLLGRARGRVELNYLHIYICGAGAYPAM